MQPKSPLPRSWLEYSGPRDAETRFFVFGLAVPRSTFERSNSSPLEGQQIRHNLVLRPDPRLNQRPQMTFHCGTLLA
jgi:hypothetical protein